MGRSSTLSQSNPILKSPALLVDELIDTGRPLSLKEWQGITRSAFSRPVDFLRHLNEGALLEAEGSLLPSTSKTNSLSPVLWGTRQPERRPAHWAPSLTKASHLDTVASVKALSPLSRDYFERQLHQVQLRGESALWIYWGLNASESPLGFDWGSYETRIRRWVEWIAGSVSSDVQLKGLSPEELLLLSSLSGKPHRLLVRLAIRSPMDGTRGQLVLSI